MHMTIDFIDFSYFTSIFSPIQQTAGLIAQLIEQCTGIAELQSWLRIPSKAEFFYQAFCPRLVSTIVIVIFVYLFFDAQFKIYEFRIFYFHKQTKNRKK